MSALKFRFSLGCRRDPKDERDIPMGLVLPVVPVPVSVDYTARMTPVRDQGEEGTCVAFATVVGVKEYEDTKEYKKLQQLSPRYLYSLCKKFDGLPFEEGTYPRMALKVLLNYGVCHESFWPYQPHQKDRPHKGADKDATRFKIKAYARLKGLAEMKRSLIFNGPFLAGVKVFKSWFNRSTRKSGLVPMPKKGEDTVGGHAVCIVGYDDRKELFKFKNSWGRRWADHGYGYLPYAYMRDFCVDAWSATDLIEDPKALVRGRLKVIREFT